MEVELWFFFILFLYFIICFIFIFIFACYLFFYILFCLFYFVLKNKNFIILLILVRACMSILKIGVKNPVLLAGLEINT